MVDDFSDLETSGFQVVSGVISAEQCDDWIAHIRSSAGACHAHSDLMWSIREHAAIIGLFARAWKTDARLMRTGYDGVGYRAPGKRGLQLDWHVDQGPLHATGRAGLQAVLCLTDVDERTGGTSFLAGSHEHHAELCRRACTQAHYSEGAWEFVDVDVDDPLLHAEHPEVQPSAPKGSVIMWDSRVVHRVCPARDPQSCRCVVYLSMLPDRYLTEGDRVRRRIFYEDGVATTHWPAPCVDRGEERRPPSVRYCEVNATRRALIG